MVGTCLSRKERFCGTGSDSLYRKRAPAKFRKLWGFGHDLLQYALHISLAEQNYKSSNLIELFPCILPFLFPVIETTAKLGSPKLHGIGRYTFGCKLLTSCPHMENNNSSQA